MKILNEECLIATRIREVEQFLRDKRVSISYRLDGLLFTVAIPNDKEQSFVIREGESNYLIGEFPTQVDGSKIQTLEHYLCGD